MPTLKHEASSLQASRRLEPRSLDWYSRYHDTHQVFVIACPPGNLPSRSIIIGILSPSLVKAALHLHVGWSRPWRRHAVNGWNHSCRQELREDTLHSSQHLLLWCWDSCRHRECHRSDLTSPCSTASTKHLDKLESQMYIPGHGHAASVKRGLLGCDMQHC